MQLDEVMALTNEELRIKADELMGGEPLDSLCDGEIDEAAQGYWQCLKCGEYGNWDNTEHKRRRPDYPNDIAAAWGLHERGCKASFSERAKYLIYLGELCQAQDEDIAWPFAMRFLDPRTITRAFVMARR